MVFPKTKTPQNTQRLEENENENQTQFDEKDTFASRSFMTNMGVADRQPDRHSIRTITISIFIHQ